METRSFAPQVVATPSTQAAAQAMPNDGEGVDQSIPLSLPQREVWLDHRAWPDSPHLNIGGGAFLVGRFDLAIFKAALKLLVAETEALRLVPHENGSQTLLAHFEPALELVDIAPCADPKAAMRHWWDARIQQPFELGEKPPWRFSLLRASDELHGLTIQFHHLVMDGWGTSLIMQRWSSLFNTLTRQEAVLPLTSGGYTAFIQESTTYRASEAFARDAVYWREQLPSLPEPVIERRSAGTKSNRLPSSQPATLSIARTAFNQMSDHAAKQNFSAFNYFLAALAIYFARTGHTEQVVIGVPSLNRGGRRFKDTPGMFVGVMPISVNLKLGTTCLDLLAQVNATMRSALRHPRYPLSELGRALDLVRTGRDGLFDVLLSFERQDYELAFGSAQLVDSRQLFSGLARYPVGVTVCEFHPDEDVELILESSSACFEPGEARQLGPRIWGLAEQLMANPDAPTHGLALVPAQERLALLNGVHAHTAQAQATVPFITQFEAQVKLAPNTIALVWDGGSLSYDTLNERANVLAKRIVAAGAAANSIVALAIERSADMVIGILAIAKSGAAFLPLDPDAPVARLADIVTEAHAVALLIAERSSERLAHLHPKTLIADWALRADEPSQPMPLEGPQPVRHHLPSGTDLAYVLFTSGSTGRPKGVMIEHGMLAHRLAWLSKAYGITPQDRSAQATQITFDPALIELCLPLIHGASVALPPPGRVLPETLADFCIVHGATFTAFVPSTLSRFLDGVSGKPGLKLRVACCGGEVLSPELASRYLQVTNARLFNVYGPTETVIFATAWECKPATDAVSSTAALPIGKPIDDSRIYVLDTHKDLLPFGVAGEIYIGGSAVGRGYLNRPDLTKNAFLPDPFVEGGRIYRTGDRGWMDTDGNLHFVGRLDRQIKLRGYRIELGEIESALLMVEGVSQAAAKLVTEQGKPSIHAWVASRSGHTAQSLQRSLRVRLPDYMIPAGISVLRKLPESSVGKIDYAALPQPVPMALASVVARAPGSGLETDLLTLWRRVLERPTLSVEDNFFDAGGDSLAAVSVLTGIESLVGRRVPMYLITERPTVEGLAAALSEGTSGPGLLVRLGSGPALTPLYLAASGHGDTMRFQNLARALAASFDLRMLQPPSASTVTRTVDLAALYAGSVMKDGGAPCLVAGFSVGGLAALETARQLQERGINVQALFLIDTIFPSRLWGGTTFWRLLGWFVRVLHIEDLSMNGRRLGVMLKDAGLVGQVMAVSGHRPRAFDGPCVLVKSSGLALWNGLLFSYWKRLLGRNLIEVTVKGLHGSMFEVANVGELARVMAQAAPQALPK